MNDCRRQDIGRFFDGEIGEADRLRVLGEIERDGDARAYLEALGMLRRMAREHDPSRMLPRRAVAARTLVGGHRNWALLAATAASLALIAIPRDRVVDRPGMPPNPAIEKPSATATVARTPRPPLEVELYGWANAQKQRPGQAARLVLTPAVDARRRSPADEILALELANASRGSSAGLRRIAVSKGPRSPAPVRAGLAPSRSRAVPPSV